MNFVRLSHDSVTYDVDRDVSTSILSSLHQEMRSIAYVSLYIARWYAAIGAFRSSLLFRSLDGVPS